MRRTIAIGFRGPALCLLASALAAILLAVAGSAGAADVDALQEKVDRAQGEAESLASELSAAQDRLGAAEQRAAEASEREAELSALLATGRERSEGLAVKVAGAEHRLAEEKRRLRRARQALAGRLVAIYMAGTPDGMSLVLGSADFDELTTRTEYLDRIEEADARLAERVEQVRDEVHRGWEHVFALKARADAYNERLAAAHSQIAAVRSGAEAAAGELQSLAGSREATLASLRSKIDGWVGDIEAAEAASHASAEETVGRWLGGPYSIPTYIVMCESGGNYSALNPSSGAGGAYQILPSTWDLYGGKGAPHEAPKAEQDRIAAEIWADSGGGAWVCA
ncbi:MAG: transglycosylase family protein [Solirubrobacterales bacterium]